MLDYQKDFIHFCLNYNILKLGDFTLKSGRKSPYFFNLGELNDGEAYTHLSQAYATTINTNFSDDYDVLFGPAYKGIPLATCTAMSLLEQFNRNVAVCFNRKEAKTHGEGGMLMGASLKNKRVIVVDDVLTAGTAFQQAADLITKEGGILAGAVIALNRQEKREDSSLSAVQEMESLYKIKIASIIDVYNVIDYLLEQNNQLSNASLIQQHLDRFGANPNE